MKIECVDLGCSSYEEVFAWQRKLAASRRKGEIDDHLLLLEHPPVITMGRRDAASDLLVSRRFLKEKGIGLVQADRGGRMTYHGPGQLVAYFIFHLRHMSIPSFVHKAEEIVIRLLDDYQLEGTRDERYPGVWIDEKKIAAVGFHIDRHVSTHGVALNVHGDLRPYRYFNPCGISDRAVTSLEKELGWHPPMQEVKQKFFYYTLKLFQDEEGTEERIVSE